MIAWTEQAFRQLDHIRNLISASDGDRIAEQVTSRILSSVQQLAKFPRSGRAGRVPSTRELVILKTPFIAAYTLQRGEVVILALYHGAQRWPEQL